MVEGKGTIIIKDGKIMEDNLKKEKYSLDELGSLLRQKNIFNTVMLSSPYLNQKEILVFY